jgi:hypothetical protein
LVSTNVIRLVGTGVRVASALMFSAAKSDLRALHRGNYFEEFHGS